MGQGAPTTGGIPSFINLLMAHSPVPSGPRLEHMNTTPKGQKRPGALHLSNVGHLFRDMWSLFWRARKRDIVHLNLAPAPTLPLLRALALCCVVRLSRAKLVLHAHSGRINSCLQQPGYRALMRVVLKLVHSFVVVSKVTEGELVHLSDRVVRISNGVDARAILTGPKPEDRLTLTFVGTVCERKGLIDLRDALATLRNAGAPLETMRVLIVGDAKQEGPGVYEKVRQAFAEAHINGVEFTGALPQSQVIEALARTHIFCLPSHWEGTPISLLEAMAAETAVIATRVGEVPLMLGNGSAGVLIEPHDPIRLASAIQRLAKDEGERDRLGREARKRIEDEYSFDRMTIALQDLYRRLIDHSR